MPPTELFDQDTATVSEVPPEPEPNPSPLRALLEARPPLLAPDIDRQSLRRDSKIFFGALAAGLVLLGSVTWVALRLIADAQHTAPSRPKATKAAAAGHVVDHRSISIPTTGLPAGPQVGQTIVLPVLTDDTSNVDDTLLYDDDKVVSRVAGVAASLSWTPKAAGVRTLKVVFDLSSGAQAVSPDIKVTVVAAHAGSSNVAPDVLALAQRLVDAINNKDWNAVRSLDPTKAQWSDSRFTSNYNDLQRDTLVPVVTATGRNGATRLFAGLFAEQQGGKALYCVTWDVNVANQQVAQTSGRQLRGTSVASDATVADVQQQLTSACANG